jgi:antitoxin Phd
MVWPVYDAKARFSEVLDATLKEGPQVITKRGVEAAVLISIDEWKWLQAQRRPSIKDVLLDPNGPHDIEIPPRRAFRIRRPIDLE